MNFLDKTKGYLGNVVRSCEPVIAYHSNNQNVEIVPEEKFNAIPRNRVYNALSTDDGHLDRGISGDHRR